MLWSTLQESPSALGELQIISTSNSSRGQQLLWEQAKMWHRYIGCCLLVAAVEVLC
jgi:hypothetical protein